MKYLIVERGQVYYTVDGTDLNKKPIDQINKDDLLTLLKQAISDESFEMDPYSPETVHNAAHQSEIDGINFSNISMRQHNL